MWGPEHEQTWEEALAGRGRLGAAWLDRDGDVLVTRPDGLCGYGDGAYPLSTMAGRVSDYGPLVLLAASLTEHQCRQIARETHDPEARRKEARRAAEPAAREAASRLRLRRLFAANEARCRRHAEARALDRAAAAYLSARSGPLLNYS